MIFHPTLGALVDFTIWIGLIVDEVDIFGERNLSFTVRLRMSVLSAKIAEQLKHGQTLREQTKARSATR